MISCDLLYIRAIKYYKLPMIRPEIATYLKLYIFFPLWSALSCSSNIKCRHRMGHSKVIVKSRETGWNISGYSSPVRIPSLFLIIWFGLISFSDLKLVISAILNMTRTDITYPLWDLFIVPPDFDHLFSISYPALQNLGCSQAKKYCNKQNQKQSYTPRCENYSWHCKYLSNAWDPEA